jgi:O-antigen/teichoic acid export membrane protein
MFFIQLGESKAETVLVQKVNFLAQTARLLLLAGLYFLSLLTLDTFIVVSYVSSVFTIAVILFTFLIKKRKEYFSFVYSYIDAKGIVKYLVRYCIPLIVLTLVIFGHDFFDRWFLQTVAGSVEQAYFSLAFQWSAISLLFTTSMLNIFWREIAVSFGENDFDRMRTMFLKASKALYFLSSAIAFFVAFNAEGLLSHLVGDKYLHAKVVIILLAFYPIHQTFGQINGAFYYATERVSLYRNLTIVGLIFGVATSYFLLAPNNAIIPGLQLGSLGLALKMLIVNIITVNLILYYNTRFLGLFFGRVLVDQIISVIVVGICSGAAFLIIQQIGLHDFWFQLGGMGILQVSFLFGVAYVCPQVTGLTRMEIRHYGQLVKDRVW